MPNDIGILVHFTDTQIERNAIGDNTTGGVVVDDHGDSTPVTLVSNSIFKNGDSSSEDAQGILYLNSPPSTPSLFAVASLDLFTDTITYMDDIMEPIQNGPGANESHVTVPFGDYDSRFFELVLNHQAVFDLE